MIDAAYSEGADVLDVSPCQRRCVLMRNGKPFSYNQRYVR